jgi:hypothetical protein
MNTINSPVPEVEMDQLQHSGESKIIINCRNLKYIYSSGLRIFL